MSEWFHALEGIAQVLPTSREQLEDWPDSRFRGSESRLTYIPVAMSELYIIGQSLPLTALQTERGPLLVAELKAGGRTVAPFDESGAWRLPYRPLALRLLPFIAQADGSCWRLESQPVADTVRQNPGPILQALSGFARSVQTVSALLGAAIAAGLVKFETDPTQPPVLQLNLPPEKLEPAQAQACRLVEILRFSQQAKGMGMGMGSGQIRSTTPLFATAQRSFEPEQLLSFDEAISFPPRPEA